MAGKAKSVYICSECGYESPKWFGCCPGCGEWNTMNEEIKAPVAAAAKSGANARSVKTYALSEITADEEIRYQTGLTELDRVLGGGIVKGSLVLLSGDPGIGKSTILLQICQYIGKNLDILYVSGEESVYQIKLRADRLGVTSPTLTLMSQTDVQAICEYININKPGLVIIDSIQTMVISELNSSAGSVTQVRESTSMFMRTAKSSNIPIIVVGHVNKDGNIAGPKVLEHIVDAVLYFEGDRNMSYRILRAVKNRYGSTNEIGVFEMLDAGLREVDNPSEILLSHYETPLSGIAVGASVDGIRPYLIEVQALVSNAAYGTPQRTATGYDNKRMNMLLAVLEKRVGMKMFSKDVFLNFAGGFKVADPGLDLAVTAAVISSYYDRPIGEGICLAGEIGLSGEVRPAPRTEQRISEAARLGFRRIVVSGYLGRSIKKPKGIEIVTINSIDQLPRALFAEG